MKYMKFTFIGLMSILLLFMLVAFLASFSFQNMFYNEKNDSLIVIRREKSTCKFIYSKDKRKFEGSLDIKEGKIVFEYNNKNVATGLYSHKQKIIEVTDENNHTKIKYKQISSIFEYLKAIF